LPVTPIKLALVRAALGFPRVVSTTDYRDEIAASGRHDAEGQPC